MKSAETELVELKARQYGILLEFLFCLAAAGCLFLLAPAAERGSNELQTVFLCAVAGFGVGLVTFVHRLLEIMDTCCPRCNEPFYACPFRLPLLLPRRCASCSQSLRRPDETPGPSAV